MSGLRNVPAAMAAAAEAAATSAEPGLETIRVARYRRASTDEGNQPYSLDAQELRLVPYIGSHPGWVEAGDYVERASAKDVIGRPQLQQLLHDAAAGKFDLVLVARIDRWSRNPADLLKTVTCLSEHNVALRSATEPCDTSNRDGQDARAKMGIFAELERGLIIDRIARGNASKISRACR